MNTSPSEFIKPATLTILARGGVHPLPDPGVRCSMRARERRASNTADVLRRRHRFICIWPRRDRSGQWLQKTWLWWTWDFLPPRVGHQIASTVDQQRVAK